MIKYEYNDVQLLEAGPVRQVVINRKTIVSNATNKVADPPIVITEDGKPGITCHSVYIDGPSHIVYDPTDPAPLNAVVYVESDKRMVALLYAGVEVNEELLAAFEQAINPPQKVELQSR
jgi:hypothetical protein